MVRRSVLILLCIVGLIASGVAAVSGDEPDYSARQWEEVFEEFDLEPAGEVPGGVTPLVVTSPGELRKLLAGAPPSRMEFHVSASDLQDLSALMTGELLGLTETYVELHATNSHEWPVIFHLYAKVWMIGSGSFWQITECNERVYFTGWLPWSGHEGEWSDHHIAWNCQSVEVEGGAVFYGYILIPGIGEIRVYEYRYHLVIDYSLY